MMCYDDSWSPSQPCLHLSPPSPVWQSLLQCLLASPPALILSLLLRQQVMTTTSGPLSSLSTFLRGRELVRVDVWWISYILAVSEGRLLIFSIFPIMVYIDLENIELSFISPSCKIMLMCWLKLRYFENIRVKIIFKLTFSLWYQWKGWRKKSRLIN